MEILDGSRVAFNSDTLIYFLEKHPRYRAPAGALMHRVEVGSLAGSVATLALAEVLVLPYKRNRQRIAREFRNVLSGFPNLHLVELSAEIADGAARLRAQYDLKMPDSVHVATALAQGADWIVTNDREFRRTEPEGIKVWLFDENLQED